MLSLNGWLGTNFSSGNSSTRRDLENSVLSLHPTACHKWRKWKGQGTFALHSCLDQHIWNVCAHAWVLHAVPYWCTHSWPSVESAFQYLFIPHRDERAVVFPPPQLNRRSFFCFILSVCAFSPLPSLTGPLNMHKGQQDLILHGSTTSSCIMDLYISSLTAWLPSLFFLTHTKIFQCQSISREPPKPKLPSGIYYLIKKAKVGWIANAIRWPNVLVSLWSWL